MPNPIHNIFIDHVDKSSNDSGYHHHHGTNDHDILHHKHDGGDDRLHEHHLDDYDYIYSTAYHLHRTVEHDNHDHDGFHNYDNLTGGDPYNHLPE